MGQDIQQKSKMNFLIVNDKLVEFKIPEDAKDVKMSYQGMYFLPSARYVVCKPYPMTIIIVMAPGRSGAYEEVYRGSLAMMPDLSAYLPVYPDLKRLTEITPADLLFSKRQACEDLPDTPSGKRRKETAVL